MDRRYAIQMLYDKPKIAGFQFDKLWHTPLSYYLSQQDIAEIYQISNSAKLNALPIKKYGMVDEILRRRGFTRLHAGTNRLVYKSEYDSEICLKVGIDIVGREANVGELHTQEILKPFCTKVFEVTPCGTVAMVERVNAIKNRYQFEDVADIIFNILIVQFAGIVLEDVGTNFFMNWGIRENFGPVVLDFPYAYEADITKLHCIQRDKFGVQCTGLIDYDDGLNNIICNECGTRYTARELRKYYSDRHLVKTIKSKKGEIRMSFKTRLKVLNKETGEYKVYGDPFANKEFRNSKGKKIYPTPPEPLESDFRPNVKLVLASDNADRFEVIAKVDNDTNSEDTEKKEKDETYLTEITDVTEIDDKDVGMKIFECDKGPVIDEKVETNDSDQNDISEVEAQTPLTTYASNNSRNYVNSDEPHDDEEDDIDSDEEDDDYELNISAEQKAEVDKVYEEIIDSALEEVANDPNFLTNKEISKTTRYCCSKIIKALKNSVTKKDIKDYIRFRIINDTSNNKKNIDEF